MPNITDHCQYNTKMNLSLTIPFWILKPNWYFRSGLTMVTSTTAGHEQTVIFTTSWCRHFYKELMSKE